MNYLEKTFTVTKTLYECVKQFTVLQWHMCYDFMNTILNIFQKKTFKIILKISQASKDHDVALAEKHLC